MNFLMKHKFYILFIFLTFFVFVFLTILMVYQHPLNVLYLFLIRKIYFFSVFSLFFLFVIYKFFLIRRVKLVTHSGNFHFDDLFATATLILFLEKQNKPYKIIRTRDEKKLEKFKKQAEKKKGSVFVYDVGGEYIKDNNLFDHHQLESPKRENGILYSSFGLVWEKYGQKICNSKEIAEKIDKKIALSVDADDNGVKISENILDFKPYNFTSFLQSFYPISKKDKDYDLAFFEVVQIFKKVLKNEINITQKKIKDKEKFDEIYEQNSDKRYIIIKGNILPPDNLSKKYPDLLFLIFKINKKNFLINTVKIFDDEPFLRKKYFPKEWGGKRDEELDDVIGLNGSKFCHKGLFVAGAYSLETAEKMVKIAVDNEDEK